MQQGKKANNLKLNLGCGLVAPDGWVNIDISYNAFLAKYPKLRRFLGKFNILPKKLTEIPWPKNITVFDVRRCLPYQDNSVKFIYSSHCLEHLSKAEAKKLLGECYRVLVPGGVIRIIVPDLHTSVQKYIEAFRKWDKNSQESCPAEIFLQNFAMHQPNLTAQPVWIRVYKKFHDKNTHKWAYDEQSLAYLLKLTGFKTFAKRKSGESFIEDVNNLDLPERFEGSICFEAVK